MALPTKYIHIKEPPGDPRIKPIWVEIHSAMDRKAVGEPADVMKELGVHISTRPTLLPRIWGRVDAGVAALIASVTQRKAPENEFTATKEGYSLTMPMVQVYDLIIDLGAAMSEPFSAVELIQKFIGCTFEHIGPSLPNGKQFRAEKFRMAIEADGVDSSWHRELTSPRSFFTHHGTIYLAVDTSQEPNDALLMKENLRLITDPETYVRYSDLREVPIPRRLKGRPSEIFAQLVSGARRLGNACCDVVAPIVMQHFGNVRHEQVRVPGVLRIFRIQLSLSKLLKLCKLCNFGARSATRLREPGLAHWTRPPAFHTRCCPSGWA